MLETIATVIIPTFGNATFAGWAIKSVQNQTVKNIEICIICDGSPENMVSFFRNIEKEDSRVKVFVFPKSPRTGEPYRDIIIRQSTGKIICYCSHDDLWLPNHIQEVEKTLRRYKFTHSIHACVDVPQNLDNENNLFKAINWIDLREKKIVKEMFNGQNYFGLTFGAHTRESYDSMEEGWVTTPKAEIPTDLYMWLKFLSAFGNQCRTTQKLTALNFRRIDRQDWSEEQRKIELKCYFEKIQDPTFLNKICVLANRSCPFFQRKKIMCLDIIARLFSILSNTFPFSILILTLVKV
jgi:glycosyltransferase involved in cell wall biosynthesis